MLILNSFRPPVLPNLQPAFPEHSWTQSSANKSGDGRGLRGSRKLSAATSRRKIRRKTHEVSPLRHVATKRSSERETRSVCLRCEEVSRWRIVCGRLEGTRSESVTEKRGSRSSKSAAAEAAAPTWVDSTQEAGYARAQGQRSWARAALNGRKSCALVEHLLSRGCCALSRLFSFDWNSIWRAISSIMTSFLPLSPLTVMNFSSRASDDSFEPIAFA